MNVLIWGSVLLITIIIQSTLIPLISIRGIYPDVLLIIVVSYALLSGKENGVGMGFFAGLLQDLASGGIFGIGTLSKLTTGYLFGLAERKVFKEHVLLPILATIVATIFNGLVGMLLLLIFGYKVDLIAALTQNIMPLMGYNLIVAVPIHHAVYRLIKFTAE
ncbi:MULTISPECIES: rod shape-determining protein MreD [Pelosinus]|uniref:Rod shape-determining protein MreD n=2 Tax=Pelosinus TaxID=365348 RepID=I9DCS6_9FIRM|nr:MULTISPECIES: rod shape-determining protein MreD [Pelosinus]AJQ27081.1 rod shape-determining protein MreD [Pelosinus fermentans JBW45]MCC5466736.1 rod shape-determining protein MreD [Pelosinus baikalensis]